MNKKEEMKRSLEEDNEKPLVQINVDQIIQDEDDILLAKRYKPIKKLGKGSFGVVVEAHDQKTDTHVAIKIFKYNESSFIKEAENEVIILQDLMKKYNNPGTSRVLHFFGINKYPCIVFELLSKNLYQIMIDPEVCTKSLDEIRKFARQILLTLKRLSEFEPPIIHSDLKPENIMICPKKSEDEITTYRIIDFGSASRDKQNSFYKQTRWYRAPEMILRIPYDVAIDIWSLGCILVEMRTGKPLFTGNDSKDQLKFIMTCLGNIPPAMQQKTKFRNISELYNTIMKQPMYYSKSECKSLQDTLKTNDSCPDDREFYNLITQMLKLDPEKRITASDALTHPFFILNNV